MASRRSPLHDESDRVIAAYERRQAADPRYSWFNPGQQFLMQQRDRAVLRLLAREGLTDLRGLRVLELGCGNGNWLRDLVRWGASPARMTGVDLLTGRLQDAVRMGPPGARFVMAAGAELPFASESFDLVLQSTVFSSILDQSVRRRTALELRRVLTRTGSILWYDYHVDNPANPDVRGVPQRELPTLFPGCAIVMQRIGLAPPVARALAPWSWVGCLLLEQLPFLRTHTLAIVHPRR